VPSSYDSARIEALYAKPTIRQRLSVVRMLIDWLILGQVPVEDTDQAPHIG
jgi:hypothetical protein